MITYLVGADVDAGFEVPLDDEELLVRVVKGLKEFY